MKKTTIKHLVALLLMLMAAASADAQKEAYAVYTSNDSILAFYYDDQMSSRPGRTYYVDNDYMFPNWSLVIPSTKKVVFDPSFADARPTWCREWFAHDQYLEEGSCLETIEGIEYLNTSEVTDMSNMFFNCVNLQELDVSHFNTAKVTDMSGMFSGCSSLKSLDVSKFNTANVIYMSSMFRGCSGLKSLDVSKFNTANVTYIGFMFDGCSSLTSLDVSKFDTGKVTSLNFMFRGCSGLNSLDLSGWDTGNVDQMLEMFYDCQSLTTIYSGDGWNTDNVTRSSYMFSKCYQLVGGMGTVYNVSHLDKEYAHADGGQDNPGYLTLKGGYAVFDDGVLTFYNDSLMAQHPGTAYVLNTGSETPGWMTNHKNQITKVVFTPEFADARPRSTHQWFDEQMKLKTIEGMGYLNTSNVTDMAKMFHNCHGLTTISVGGFVTDKVTDMSSMFSCCWFVKNLDVGGWNTSAVTNMSHLFQECEKLTALNVKGWDTGKVTDMSYMFCDVGAESLDLRGWDTHNVTTMWCMFNNNKCLKNINMSGWDTGNVTNMNGMFQKMTVVEVLDLSAFNTGKVEDFKYMFAYSPKLRTIYCGDDWQVNSSATSSSMFYECEALVGGEGSSYQEFGVTDGTFAHVDGGTGNPGYLSLKVVPTGIDAQRLNEGLTDGEVQRFGIDGTRLNGQRRGLNMVRQADGTVKKVVVR